MPVLRLELRVSRALATAVVLVHAAGAAGMLLIAPDATGAFLGLLLLCLGILAAWNRALLRGRGSVRLLELGDERQVGAVLASGERLHGRASARCHVGPWWVVLPLASPRRTVLVARGMLGSEEFRRLRLWALWGRVPAPARAGPG